MKKNDLLLIGSVALYSYLFYNQSAGVNYLLFNLFLIFALIVKNGMYKNLFNTSWWLAIAGSIFSSACIIFYGNTLSIIANILSISLVAAFSVDRNSSLLFAGIYSIYSYLSAIVMMFVDWIENNKKKEGAGQKSGSRFFLYIIPVIISLVFFFLYRDANPLFKNFTSNISFDFITWPLVRFMILGFILLYGYFYHRSISIIAAADSRALNNLSSNNFSRESNTLWGMKIELSNELLSGIILFSLLNILLFFVNVLDFQYLWLMNSLPEGLSFSESVHQGIGTLITSIIFAVLIILIYFRGNINFSTTGRTIKILAYIWVLQNAFMIISTVMRNQLYINEFSLTYKRIGVYVYLALSLIGLFTTLIKIASAKSNWYLFRSNSWLFYGVLVISCAINWDRMITDFNLKNSKSLDLNYLTNLSSSNTDLLLDAKEVRQDSKETNDFIRRNIYVKTFNFLKDMQSKEWQSWNSDDHNVFKNILEVEKKGKITSLLLANNNIHTLAPIKEFKNLKKLDLSSNQFTEHSELSYFPKIEELNLSGNTVDSIGEYKLEHLPQLENLTKLDLSNNSISDFNGLKNFKNLEYLDISDTKQDNIKSLPRLANLKILNISRNIPGDLSVLNRFPTLAVLKINSTNSIYLKNLPPLKTITELEISNINLGDYDWEAIKAVNNLIGLKKLDLSSNNLKNLYLVNDSLFELKMKTKNFSSLTSNVPCMIEDLNLASNKIFYLDGVEKIEYLTLLNVSDNSISNLSPLQYCEKLEYLNLSGNKIDNLTSLQNLNNLKTLLLSNNNISKITYLKNIKGLEYLDLSRNNLSDISSLRELTHLRHLNISHNINLTDIGSIQYMENLEELNMLDCNIRDLSVLFNLKKLKKIYVSGLDKRKTEDLKKHLPDVKIESYSSDIIERSESY
jgi:Leucine-rich repeat (LRR) protein